MNKRTTGFVVITLLVASLVLISFGLHNGRAGGSHYVPKAKKLARPWVKTSGPVTLRQAEMLVRLWIMANKDQCHWQDGQKLEEVTPVDVRNRLHAQIFKLCDAKHRASETYAFLIKDRKVYPMSVGLRSNGLMDVSVFDIDLDSKDDLVYVYSRGSGLSRSIVEAYRFGTPTPTPVYSNFSIFGEGSMKKTANKIDLYVNDYTQAGKPTHLRLGELIVLYQSGQYALDIKPDPNLPKEWEDRIWRRNAANN